MYHDTFRLHARPQFVAVQDVPHHPECLILVEIGLAVSALVVVDVRAFQAERFVIRRECLRHACVDEMTAALLEMMERHPDEADPIGQIRRAPGQAAGLVV